MSGRKKESVDLILMKGNKLGLTKSEIEQRRTEEEAARGACDNVVPPSYLSAKQKKEFVQMAEELMRMNLLSNLDVDTLAQYIDTRSQYIDVIKAISKFKPIKKLENGNVTTSREYNSLHRTKDLLIRQLRSISGELGLTLGTRMKLVIPKKEEKKGSKLAKYRERS